MHRILETHYFSARAGPSSGVFQAHVGSRVDASQTINTRPEPSLCHIRVFNRIIKGDREEVWSQMIGNSNKNDVCQMNK